MRKFSIIFLSVFLLLQFAVWGQDDFDAAAVLEYYDDEYEIQIFDSDGFQVDEIYYGMELLSGDTIKTNGSYAELRLDPNGSIIKLAPDTDFTVETLQDNTHDVNAFALLKGKIRTVAAQENGSNKYSIRTPSAVCGVRGTDFGLEAILGSRDAAAVLKGSIEFININTGKSLTLTEGMAADVFAEVFAPFKLPPDQLQQMFQEMDFVQLDPSSVPGQTAEKPPAAEEEEKEEPEIEEEEVLTEEPAETAAQEVPEIPPEDRKNLLEPVFNFLADKVGMEIGTFNANGETYAKAIVQPTITIGKFSMGLYLPIIYRQNLFDRNDWYAPKGNNEWSFGTDHKGEGAGPIIKDVIADTALKIKYIAWGEQRDPFFFKLGNINNVTVGHGIIMYRYANDFDFPVVRRVGINAGFDFSAVGIEAVVNDLAEPEIFGGRLYFRPVPDRFPFAFGIAAIADINPAGNIAVDPESEEDPVTYGDPVFINTSVDIDFPIIEKDLLSIILFGDVGGMLPYFRKDYDEYITSGLALDTLYSGSGDSFRLRNYGVQAGLMGNVAAADWRLEYLYYNGTFRPSYFNAGYDRMRGQYVMDLAAYFENPDAAEYLTQTMGIYGSLGFSIKEAFRFEGGYLWPWNVSPFSLSDDDFFHLKLALNPGVIPVVGLGASIAYERTKFIPTLLKRGEGASLSPFDANTVLRGELIYPAAPILDVVLLVITSAAYDENGALISDPDNPFMPKVRTSVSFETRIHF